VWSLEMEVGGGGGLRLAGGRFAVGGFGWHCCVQNLSSAHVGVRLSKCLTSSKIVLTSS